MSDPQLQLPFGVSLDDLNPDLAFAHELASFFREREISFSMGGSAAYSEIQVGYTKRPAFFPFMSVQTADTEFPITTSGAGGGKRARTLETEFLVCIRYESSDPEEGFARLTDLKWDAVNTLMRRTEGGRTYRYLDVTRAELLGMSEENPESNSDWAGYAGQVLIIGTVRFL